MSKVVAKLRELRNASVNWISLVDRAATRIPFRVIKRDEEEFMDLTKIFKTDVKPEITAVVVRDSADTKTVEAVKTAIAAAGFSVERVKKSDDGATLVYNQVEKQPDDVALVRLSDDVVLAVKGFSGVPSEGKFSKMAASDGFFSGVGNALNVLQQEISKVFVNGEPLKVAGEIGTLVDDFKGYTTTLIGGLPFPAFKVDLAVQKAVQEREEALKADSPSIESLLAKAPRGFAKDSWDGMSTHDKLTWMTEWFQNNDVASAGPSYKGDKCTQGDVDDWVAGGMSKGDIADKMKAKGHSQDEIDEMHGKAKDKAAKGDKVEQLLQSIANKVDGLEKRVEKDMKDLSSKVVDISTKQEKQQKVLDDVVQKADTLSNQLKTTVKASPGGGDTPAVVDVQKKDEDPRTGFFDTAFLPNRGRVVKTSRY